MQVCTLFQTDNHASTQPLSSLQAGCPSCCPTNSVKALKAKFRVQYKPVRTETLTAADHMLQQSAQHHLEGSRVCRPCSSAPHRVTDRLAKCQRGMAAVVQHGYVLRQRLHGVGGMDQSVGDVGKAKRLTEVRHQCEQHARYWPG